MTQEIIHVGGIGQGLAMKLINNMLYHVSSIVAIEAMVLGAKAGRAGHERRHWPLDGQ